MAKIEIGNDKWATYQGGLAGQIIKDDGTVELFNLANGRASEDTAISRDGTIRTIKPFEPNVSLVDGTMALSLGSQGETLLSNSGFSGETTPPQNWGGSSLGKTVVDSIYGNLVKAIEFDTSASQNYIQQSVSLLSGSKYCLSVKIESFDGVTNIQNIMNIYGLTGTKTYFEDGVEIPFSKAIESGKTYKLIALATSDSLAATVRIGSGTTSTAPAKVVLSLPQIELGENITSFILSPIGATATRLADTGVVSPDLSDEINSEDFTIELKVKLDTQDGARRFYIGDGTTVNRTMINMGNNGNGRVDFEIITSLSSSTMITLNSVVFTDWNIFKFVVKRNNIEAFVNGVSVGTSTNDTYDSPKMKIISLGDFNSAYPMIGKHEYLTITSN